MNKAVTKIKDLSLDEMLALRTQIDQRLADLAASEVAKLEARLETLKGIANIETAARSDNPAPQAKQTRLPSKAKSKRGPKKGTKVAAKYVDKKSGNSWTGRGLAPTWIKDHEAKGGKRDDFLVET